MFDVDFNDLEIGQKKEPTEWAVVSPVCQDRSALKLERYSACLQVFVCAFAASLQRVPAAQLDFVLRIMSADFENGVQLESTCWVPCVPRRQAHCAIHRRKSTVARIMRLDGPNSRFENQNFAAIIGIKFPSLPELCT
jgi:hypothetical protein